MIADKIYILYNNIIYTCVFKYNMIYRMIILLYVLETLEIT